MDRRLEKGFAQAGEVADFRLFFMDAGKTEDGFVIAM